MLFRDRHDIVHVDALVFLAHAIADGIEPLAAHIDRRAVGQVAARIEVQPHEGIAGLQQRQEHRLVHLRTRIRLHIGKVAAEQLLRAVDRQRFDHIGVVATAVIALAGISFGIFVRKYAARSFKHRL